MVALLKASAKVFYAKELQSSQRKATSVGLSSLPPQTLKTDVSCQATNDVFFVWPTLISIHRLIFVQLGWSRAINRVSGATQYGYILSKKSRSFFDEASLMSPAIFVVLVAS